MSALSVWPLEYAYLGQEGSSCQQGRGCRLMSRVVPASETPADHGLTSPTSSLSALLSILILSYPWTSLHCFINPSTSTIYQRLKDIGSGNHTFTHRSGHPSQMIGSILLRSFWSCLNYTAAAMSARPPTVVQDLEQVFFSGRLGYRQPLEYHQALIRAADTSTPSLEAIFNIPPAFRAC